MIATFDKQKLLAALTPAASISQTKNTLYSVDGLLFECPPDPKFGDYDTDNPNLCRISAFDLEKGLRSTVECNVEERGMFIINTVKILQIIRAMPDGDVTIEIDSKCRVKITGGQSSFDITAKHGEEFPTMPMFIGEKVYKIPQYLIKDMISQTVYAVAQNDQRAAFNGSLFSVKDSELTVVGCDGNRLAAAKCSLPEGSPDAEMLIPGKFLLELTKLLKDTEDEVTMMIGRKHIIFKIDSLYFFTRMLDAEYLAYKKLLPATYMTEVFVAVNSLRSAVERASIVTEDKLGGSGRSPIKLEITSADGGSIVMTSVSQGGSVFEKVPAAVNGADITIGFNCRYLMDALRATPASCNTLRIRLNLPLMGIIIEPSSGTDFVSSSPDPTVFGERLLDADSVPHEKNDDDEEAVQFMSLVMPWRLNQ